MMKGKYLILGSNLGDRDKHLHAARLGIIRNIGPIKRSSSVYLTEPWGFSDQPPYYNQVIQVETTLKVHQTLDAILKIEEEIGRIRNKKWQERIIDIDILYYDNMILNDSRLTIPHPGIPYRNFVLEPLCELIPDEIHPVLKVSNAELLRTTGDRLVANKIRISTD